MKFNIEAEKFINSEVQKRLNEIKKENRKFKWKPLISGILFGVYIQALLFLEIYLIKHFT